MAQKTPKTLLIGWDAADWIVIDQLMEQGEMPILKRFISGGVRGNLATLSPTLSPILWTSIATGKRAYDHGINGFVEYDFIKEQVVPVKGSSRQVKAIWNILNEAGLKTNLVNWWPSHPAEIIDGVCVSNHYHSLVEEYGKDWPVPTSSIYPIHVQEELKDLRIHPADLTLAHILPFIPKAADLDPENDPTLKACLRILAKTASVHNAATYLMENSPWDFMAIYQESLDHFSHTAMKFAPPQQSFIGDEAYDLYKDIIKAAYKFHDMMLERLLQLAGSNCNVIILSDHGYLSGTSRIEHLPDIPASPALEHRKYGIFAANGPSFKENEKIYGASLLDITPTILHSLKLPIAEDMEGKVLNDLFKHSHKVSSIPSWELTNSAMQFLDENSIEQTLVENLSELGYINVPETDKSKYVKRELAYNRLLSLLEGSRYVQAIKEAQEEWDRHKELRTALVLCSALRETNSLKQWSSCLVTMDREYPNNGALIHQRGLLALAENNWNVALEHFNTLEKLNLQSSQLYLDIARTLLVQGEFSKGLGYFNKVLFLDNNNSAALTGKAHCLLELGDINESLASLELSLELSYYQPNAHYLLALVAWDQGDISTAESALKIAIGQAPNHQKAKLLLSKISGVEERNAKTITIISGWPRSGTSLMMSFMDKGGVECYMDYERVADESNPKGYYEHSNVLNIGKDVSWLAEAEGKAVKVVLPLLRYLPSEFNYKVVLMSRPLTEVVLSQERMKGKTSEEVMKNFPFQVALKMEQEERRIRKWLEDQANMNVFSVNYQKILEDPKVVRTELEEFLGRKLTEDSTNVVDPKLNRNKLG